MDIRKFAERFIEAEYKAFRDGDFEMLKEIEDPDIILHGNSMLKDMVGHEAHKQSIMESRNAAADLKLEFNYITGDGNVFAVSYKSSGRIIAEKPGYPVPVGKKVASDLIFVLRVKNGKIVESWVNGSVAISD